MSAAAPAKAIDRKLQLREVLDWLIADGLIDAEPATKLFQEARAARGGTARHPIAVIAEARWRSKLAPKPVITGDFLTEWLAGRLKMPFFHIDPLKIDLRSVTAVMSSEYAARRGILPVEVSGKDVTIATLEPGPAAQSFIAGQNDAAMTYEPYLSGVRDKPEAGKIIATTLDYPMVMDTFGCTPKFIQESPKLVQGMVDSYFEAVELIGREPKKSFEIMGAVVKQTGEQFEKSQSYLRWQNREANRKFFAGEIQAFSKEAMDLLLELGIIKTQPDVAFTIDTRFIK